MIRLFASIIIFLSFPLAVLAQSPPEITITHYDPTQTASGVILLTPGSNYIQITSSSGQILYQKEAPSSFDFRMQPDGTLSYRRIISGVRLVENLDPNYQIIETVHAIGYDEGVDAHEVIKFGPDHWIYFIYDEIQPFDLSAYGGYMTATLISTVIQEQQNGVVLFEWHDLDHVPISDSVANLTQPRVDYAHGNGFDIDHDGHILASFRNTSQVLKINRQTEAVIWRLGGAANQFNFTNDVGFALQHDIRRLDNGHITLFDNGNASRGYSRAMEYEINETTMTLTRTMEITGPFAFCCGNVQRLPNGNTFVNWGAAGVISEHAPDRAIVWRAEFESGFTYRAYRQEFPAWRLWFSMIGHNP